MLYVLCACNRAEILLFILVNFKTEMKTENLRMEGKEFLASYVFVNVVL